MKNEPELTFFLTIVPMNKARLYLVSTALQALIFKRLFRLK